MFGLLWFKVSVLRYGLFVNVNNGERRNVSTDVTLEGPSAAELSIDVLLSSVVVCTLQETAMCRQWRFSRTQNQHNTAAPRRWEGTD